MISSIYHREAGTGFGKAIRLNLKAVRELLGREVAHFTDLTPKDKDLLQRRFTAYCKKGSADFSPGSIASQFCGDNPPSIDNLPNKSAVSFALLTVKGKGGANE